MLVANMATYPGRDTSITLRAILSISRQVDVVNLCLNQFKNVPSIFNSIDNLNPIIPENDLKDVGKFICVAADDDEVFFVDDDIEYPRDYVDYSREIYNRYEALNPIVGYHGVIYPDVYDGKVDQRNVHSFRTKLDTDRVVNQLGTGTIYCKGWQTPELSFMENSESFVDVRFSRHAMLNNWPLICASRSAQWMIDLEVNDSIFNSFTNKWPVNVVQEVQSISGYGKLPIHALVEVKKFNDITNQHYVA